MSQADPARPNKSSRPILAQLVALALLLLTAAAVFWPDQPDRRGDGTLLVIMPRSSPARLDALAELATYLGTQARLDLRLEVVGDRAAFEAGLTEAIVVLGPDAVGLALPAAVWQPLVVGRRRVPWNLRPTSVLVSRIDQSAGAEPWSTAPSRTVFGDSLSLVCLAPLAGGASAAPVALPSGVAWGDDPYDHAGVLAAAHHGAFDHAVVRQWDADAALTSGRLDPESWRVRRLGDPVPDVMVLASRRLSRGVRLDLQEALSVLGRRAAGVSLPQARLEAHLGALGFEGFNLLLGPDIEGLRRRYGNCWPHPGP